jgi:predicted enzyme related to lactoylglutathione lyase
MHEICHVEIPTTDLAKSETFYKEVFGWKVEVDPATKYAMWTPEDGPGGGFNLVKEPCTCGESGCLVYIFVASVDDKAKEIEAAGGKIVTPKSPVGEMGWYAVFEDPAGGVVGLYESAKKG